MRQVFLLSFFYAFNRLTENAALGDRRQRGPLADGLCSGGQMQSIGVYQAKSDSVGQISLSPNACPANSA